MNKKVLIGTIIGILAIIAIAIGVVIINNNDTKNDNMLVGENEQTDNQENTINDENEGNTTKNGSKTLVVYYSAQNHTKAVAEKIAQNLNADIFEIEPEEKYSEEDLNWTNRNSRVSKEHDDE